MRLQAPVIALVLGLLFVGSTLQAATVTHIYELNNSLADSLSGPSLVSLGGTLNPTNYSFQPDQGLSLSGALSSSDEYSIELNFTWDQLGVWGRLLHFKNLVGDGGLYTNNSDLLRYLGGPDAVGSTAMGNGPFHLVVTRDATSDQFTAYLDGGVEIQITEASGNTEFTGPSNIIHFFQDDGSEERAGSVDRIRIYDGVLTLADVLHLQQGGSPFALPSSPPPVVMIIPEPGAAAMASLGLVFVRHRLRRRQS